MRARAALRLVWQGGDPLYGLRAPGELLQNLLLRCAIQTQLSYYNEFKNECRARWLEAFLGHEHLRVQRISDYGGGRQNYKGITQGLRCSWDEYLSTMLECKPETFEVRYKIGTADTASMLDNSALSRMREAEEEAGDAPPTWASASASRAMNPYLKKERKEEYRTFSETINPSIVARGLLSICTQIAAEWEHDLAFIASEGYTLAQACAEEEACRTDEDDTSYGMPEPMIPEKAIADPTYQLPAAITSSFRAASFEWTRDDVEAPSAFRATSFDLLQRAVSRQAALETLFRLKEEGEHEGREGAELSADTRWLRDKLEVWLPRFENPSRTSLSGIFLTELLTAQPAALPTEDGGLAMIDPAAIADRVLRRRVEIANEWIEALGGSAEARAALLRSDLETKLVAMLRGGDAYGEDGGEDLNTNSTG